MAQTLLQITNDVLRKVGFITGESGELSSLTDSARQVEIDIVIRNTNTVISELYVMTDQPIPTEMATSTIILVTNSREYTLPSDLVQIRYPIIFETEQHCVKEYPGGYDQMRKDQLDPSNYTGRPEHAVISPITGDLRFDYTPTSSENGDVYTLYYDKNIYLSVETSTVPFADVVTRHLINVIAEDWKRDQRRETDKEFRKKQLSLACKYLIKKQRLKGWGPRRA